MAHDEALETIDMQTSWQPRNTIFLEGLKNTQLTSQCANEKSNKSVEDIDKTFAGW